MSLGGMMALVVVCLAAVTLLDLVTATCEQSHSSVCQVLQNSQALPRNNHCNPQMGECEVNDLIDENLATCRLGSKAGAQRLLDASYKPSPLARCMPTVYSVEDIYKRKRIVATSYGDPQCLPVPKHELRAEGSLTCGEQGTRCVCDTGQQRTTDYVQNSLDHRCRCQWYVNLCDTTGLCKSYEAECHGKEASVQCKCPSYTLGRGGITSCHNGINQCKANPMLCAVGTRTVCVEIDDRDSQWRPMEEKEGQGYVCMANDTLTGLVKMTAHCRTSAHPLPPSDHSPLNYLDKCCHDQVRCLASTSNMIQDNKPADVYAFGPCYCTLEFRKCLLNLVRTARFGVMATELMRGVEAVASCEMDDGKRCDPAKSSTCQKGDLISPNIAHCKIDCSTGPLLPIQLRACYRRQCTPESAVDGRRMIDTIDHRKSSICRSVPGLPVECGMLHTRCVCDSHPAVDGFTDKCRCQYWPIFDREEH